MNHLLVREAEDSDALNISVLAGCVWVDTYAYTGVFDKISKYVKEELSEEKIREIIGTKKVLVCVNDNLLLGYLVIENKIDSECEIKTLYVLPRFHGVGIGKMLLLESLTFEFKTFRLSVWEGNDRAIRFYKNNGFTEAGEVYFDLYGDKIRNILMTLEL